MRPWPKSPRYLIEVGWTFFVAAGVGWLLGARLAAVLLIVGIGVLFVAVGAIGVGWGRRES